MYSNREELFPDRRGAVCCSLGAQARSRNNGCGVPVPLLLAVLLVEYVPVKFAAWKENVSLANFCWASVSCSHLFCAEHRPRRIYPPFLNIPFVYLNPGLKGTRLTNFIVEHPRLRVIQ